MRSAKRCARWNSKNFGTARETLRQAQELADKMRRKEEGTTDVHEYIRNPYDFIERKIP